MSTTWAGQHTIQTYCVSRPGPVARSRNRHLLKLYSVSLLRLLLVLAPVTLLTEVAPLRTFARANIWLSKIVISELQPCPIWPAEQSVAVMTLLFLCTWIITTICFPWTKHRPAYNITIITCFTLCEGLVLGTSVGS